MFNVVYTEHLKLRLRRRKIPWQYPRKIYEKPDREFYDTEENRLIAVKKLDYRGKRRNIMIAYEYVNNNTEVITIHPMGEEKIKNRKVKGRWVEI